MTKADYSEKRKDPRWQRKRLEIMERDGFECRECGGDEATLNVHHSYYVTGRDPWEYPEFSLLTLCRDCHTERHSPRSFPDGTYYPPFMEWERAIEMLAGKDPRKAEQLYEIGANASMAITYGMSPEEAWDRLLYACLPKLKRIKKRKRKVERK